MNKWETVPSGSGARKTSRPTPYKYSAELAFLEPILTLEATRDNLSKGDEDEMESASSNREVMHPIYD